MTTLPSKYRVTASSKGAAIVRERLRASVLAYFDRLLTFDAIRHRNARKGVK